MRQWRVSDVMTRDVVSVTMDMGHKTIADLLVQRSISVVPVVDGDARVCGVVSESGPRPASSPSSTNSRTTATTVGSTRHVPMTGASW